MDLSLNNISQWLVHYGYFILFLLVVIEGPITTVVGGSLVALGLFNFYLTFIIVLIGDLTSDCLYYALGRYGGENFLVKWGPYLGIRKKHLKLIKKHFEDHGGQTLIAAKVIRGFGTIFLISAGISKMPFRKFFRYNLGASLVKTLALILVGYFFYRAVRDVKSDYDLLGGITLAFVVVGLAIYQYWKQRNDFI